MKYIVTHYYEVEIEVEAENESEALEMVFIPVRLFQNTVTATLDRRVGSPNVIASDLDTFIEEAQ